VDVHQAEAQWLSLGVCYGSDHGIFILDTELLDQVFYVRHGSAPLVAVQADSLAAQYADLLLQQGPARAVVAALWQAAQAIPETWLAGTAASTTPSAEPSAPRKSWKPCEVWHLAQVTGISAGWAASQRRKAGAAWSL
jgi:hypothetical protein